jgi:fructoselysine 3-epimerase
VVSCSPKGSCRLRTPHLKLAFSTNAYTRYPLADALIGIRKAGFEGVEILADAPHAYPDMIHDAMTKSVRRQLDDLGLAVSNVNANCCFGYWRHAPPEAYFEPSLISPDPRHRSDRASLIRKTLHFAKAIGAANISITSGRLLGGMPPDRAVRQFAESIRPLLDEADRLGVNIGIECEPGLYLEYAVELHDWINRLNHPRMGANLDVGHSQVLGESIPDAVRLLAGQIWNLHIEDIPGRKHYHMVPGEGTLDWPALFAALRSINYDRYLTVELYTHTADPQDAAERSFEFLSRAMALQSTDSA